MPEGQHLYPSSELCFFFSYAPIVEALKLAWSNYLPAEYEVSPSARDQSLFSSDKALILSHLGQPLPH